MDIQITNNDCRNSSAKIDSNEPIYSSNILIDIEGRVNIWCSLMA